VSDLSAKTRADLGWGVLTAQLVARTRTPRGAAEAARLEPLKDIDAARARIEEITEARALHDEGQPLPLDGVRDLEAALLRSQKGGALDGAQLLDVASTARAGARVKRHLLERRRAPRLTGRAALLAALDEVSQPIDDAFEDGVAGPAGPRLSGRASHALQGLRHKAQRVREELERRLATLLDARHIAEHLQDRFFTQRDDRYVVPVRVDARAKVRGIVHGTSQSGQTVFVEPEELVDLNNRLKLAELEVIDEERRILSELSRLVEDALPRLQVNLEVLGALDFSDAAARLALDLKASPPELIDDTAGGAGGALDLRRARHPLMVLSGRACVPSDLYLEVGQTLIVSGPNAGGKTVQLKVAGLLALMGRAGLHLPAQEGSRVPIFDVVLTDVGDDQSLERDLSTFSAHLQHLREFLAAAGPRTLLLIDEIAVGTEPEQGAALAQAVLEALATREATVITTTHYDRLKVLPTSDPRFVNASVGFDLEAMQPTYQLKLGVPGASGAIVVARRLGLEAPICARATELLGVQQIGMEQLLLDLEGQRRRAEAERQEAERSRQEADRARAEAAHIERQAEARLEKARAGAHGEAVETLRRAREELARTTTVLRRSQGQITTAEIEKAKLEIEQAAQGLRDSAPPPPPAPGRAAAREDCRPGVAVWVTSVNGRGRVVGPLKGKKVPVQVGPLKLTAELTDLRVVDDRAAPEPRSARTMRGHNAFDAAPPAPASRGGYPTLSVRGERVDVAVAMAEKFLDDALRSGAEAVIVVHGHGTGALRDALRERLMEFPGVSGLRPGQPNEGGDGVTVITL
jgi:DNA mismatch repair protein MutS2